jgi:hypothetical protein
LTAWIHPEHNQSTDVDAVGFAAMQAVSTLSVCVPDGMIMPVLHASLSHSGHSVRAAAASSVLCMSNDIKSLIKGHHLHEMHDQPVGNLLKSGVLLLLLKCTRNEPVSNAVITALQPFFDDVTKEYLDT